MKSAQIGLFGGTFDPPHLAHLILASEAASQMNLSRILWMLAPDPPHKRTHSITPLSHRLAMLQRAVADNEKFEVSFLEMNRPGPHYTVDTVRLLAEQHPQAEITLLLGGDSLYDLPQWRDPQSLLASIHHIGVMRRPNDSISLQNLEQSLPGIQNKVYFIHALLQELSSREIRARIASRKEYRYYLHPAVYEYIEENGLYKND